MPKCVQIEVADDGKVTVGMGPSEGGDESFMKPAESVEAAVERARGLLSADAGKPASMQEAMFGADKKKAAPAKPAEKAKA
jgi:hypothetical protein